jgi:hypothetical protein
MRISQNKKILPTTEKEKVSAIVALDVALGVADALCPKSGIFILQSQFAKKSAGRRWTASLCSAGK